MRAVEELIGARIVRSQAVTGRTLMAFCDQLSNALKPGAPAYEASTLLPVETIARLFRAYFRLGVPVFPQIRPLLETLGVAYVRHGNSNDADACATFDSDSGQWEIYARYDLGPRESLCVLQQFFPIVSAVCRERIDWWEAWESGCPVKSVRERAHRFALSLLMPPEELGERALMCGLDPWALATQFTTSPGTCFYALQRRLSLPFPYFQAHLDFHPCAPAQTRMFFHERSVRARIWKKGYRRVYGPHSARRPEMDLLAARFPRSGSEFEISGLLYEGIRNGVPTIQTTCELEGIALLRPVCVAVRPNGSLQSQMFVQIVPEEFAAVLQPTEA